MGGENAHGAVAIAVQEIRARLARLFGVHAGNGVPMRIDALDRAVDQVAAHYGIGAVRRQAHADMARGVARRGLQPDVIVERVIAVHDQCLAGLDNG